MASKVIVVSRIPDAGRHASKRTREAVEKAVDAGETEANIRIERGNASRGWNIATTVEGEVFGSGKSGKIEWPEFYGRFFEYGFYSEPAMPVIRPGHRKMRKVFKEEMGSLFQGFRGVRR